MTKKQRTSTQKHAGYLFMAGIICVAVAGFIQIVYIRGTDFKRQHQTKQYQQCIKQNSADICKQNFPFANN